MAAIQLKLNRNILLIGIIACVIFIGGTVLLHIVSAQAKTKIANGLLSDFVLTFPVLYYLLILKPQKKSAGKLFLVVSICSALAYIVLPQQQREYILQIRKLTAVAELAIIVYVVTRFNKIRTAYKTEQANFADPVYNLRHAMVTVLGNTLPVKVLASEFAMLRYGLLLWKKERPAGDNGTFFTTYKQSGYVGMWCVLLCVTLIEMGGFHLILVKWSHTVAIIVTSLTAYGIIFLVADLSAIVKRCIVIDGDTIVLRTGLRWRTITNLQNIDLIEKISNDYNSETEYLKGGILKNSGNVLIRFKHSVTIEKLYGKDREVLTIIMNIDDVTGFLTACNK